MNKILYITHLSGKRLSRFWLTAIEAAHEMDYEFHLACNMCEIDCDLWEEDCKKYKVFTHQIDFNRNPMSFENIKAYKQLNNLLKRENFNIIHCNTPVGGLLGRLCGNKQKNKCIVYEAHGFHFWKGAPIFNWVIYYTVERFLAHLTDCIITINYEDYAIAKKFKLKKNGVVKYVHGVGVDIKKFRLNNFDRNVYRTKIGLNKYDFAILSIGELNKNKNHEIVIRAIAKLNNNKVHYLVAGQGELNDYLNDLTKKYHVEKQVHLLGYRMDIPQLLNSCDLYILPSKREGLNVSLLEAMAVGLPCIASKIRGNIDLLDDNISGFLFNPEDVNEITEKLKLLVYDPILRKKMSSYNLKCIKDYDISKVTIEIKDIYINTLIR